MKIYSKIIVIKEYPKNWEKAKIYKLSFIYLEEEFIVGNNVLKMLSIWGFIKIKV